MASDAIDSALVSYLAGDATLSGLLTGGVHYGSHVDTSALTPPYALVTLFTAKDVREFRRRAWEECRYLILVYEADEGTITTVREACARIDALLDGGTFAISGYTLLKSERERRYAGRIQFDEFDEFYEEGKFGALYTIWAQAN